MNPTVGTPVQVRMEGEPPRPTEVYAGLITVVHEDQSVDLAVFMPNMEVQHWPDVPHASVVGAGFRWHAIQGEM